MKLKSQIKSNLILSFIADNWLWLPLPLCPIFQQITQNSYRFPCHLTPLSQLPTPTNIPWEPTNHASQGTR